MKEQRITERILADYARRLAAEERSAATVEKYLRAVRRFAAWLEGREATGARTAAWKAHLREQGYAPSSINGMLAAVHRLYAYQGWEGCAVRYLKVQRRLFAARERELSRAEYQRLVSCADLRGDGRLALLMETICATGIRVSEVPYITLEAARAGQAEISLKGKIRTILLPGKLCRKLEKYAKQQKVTSGAIFRTGRGRPMDRREIWAQMKRLCKYAGVDAAKVFPHNLRRLFARTFYKIQRDIVKLADVLGHSSVETTRIYLRTTPTAHRAILAQMHLINAAENATEVATAKTNGTTALTGVATDAQNLSTAKVDAKDAAETLATARIDAINASDLSDDDKAALIAMVNAEKDKNLAAIDAAADVTGVALAQTKAEAKDAVLSDAMDAYLDVNGTAGLDAEAKQAVKDKINTAVSTTLNNIADAGTADAVESAKWNGTSSITKEVVTGALGSLSSEAGAEVDGIITDLLAEIEAANGDADKITLAQNRADAKIDAIKQNAASIAAIKSNDKLNGQDMADLVAKANAIKTAAMTLVTNAATPDALALAENKGAAMTDMLGKAVDEYVELNGTALTTANGNKELTFDILLNQANRYPIISADSSEIKKTENGKLSVDKPNAAVGATVTITAKPEAGYALDTLVVTDSKGNEIEVTDLGNGKFAFEMPKNKPVTIEGTFAAEEGETSVIDRFVDVDPELWYNDAIEYVVEHGLMNGTSDTTFEPNATTSRGMIVTILYRLEGEPETGASAFGDMADGIWYTDAIAWAAANKIVNGYDADTFGPNDAITREQLAAILWRYAAYKGYDLDAEKTLESFPDTDSVSDWADAALTWAYSNGIVNGSDGKLLPLGGAKRCEAAAMLMRFIENN